MRTVRTSIPKGWTLSTLGEVAEIVSGSTPKREFAAYWGGEIRWASIRDVHGLEDGVVGSTAETITREGFRSCSTQLVPPGTVLFTSRAPIGLVAVAGVELCTNQGFKNFVPGPGVLSRYLYYYLRHEAGRIDALGTGATFKEVSKRTIGGYPIVFPPVEEQRRIADVLDKADAIRRKRGEALALTDELLRATFLEMFGDPVANSRGWPVVDLGACADLASGVTKGKDYRDAKLVERPYLRVANVQAGTLALAEMKTIAVSPDEAARYALVEGDVLMTEGGDPDKLGRGTVWRGEIPGCIHQNHIFRARVDRSCLDPDFLSTQLGSSRGQRYFARAAKQTTGIASINMTQLRAFPTLVPPLERQAAFARTAALIRASHGLRRVAVEASEALFAALQHRAFRGEL